MEAFSDAGMESGGDVWIPIHCRARPRCRGALTGGNGVCAKPPGQRLPQVSPR